MCWMKNKDHGVISHQSIHEEPAQACGATSHKQHINHADTWEGGNSPRQRQLRPIQLRALFFSRAERAHLKGEQRASAISLHCSARRQRRTFSCSFKLLTDLIFFPPTNCQGYSYSKMHRHTNICLWNNTTDLWGQWRVRSLPVGPPRHQALFHLHRRESSDCTAAWNEPLPLEWNAAQDCCCPLLCTLLLQYLLWFSPPSSPNQEPLSFICCRLFKGICCRGAASVQGGGGRMKSGSWRWRRLKGGGSNPI